MGGTVYPYPAMTSQFFDCFEIFTNGSISTANYTVQSLLSLSGMTSLAQTRYCKLRQVTDNQVFQK
jgi:hypothetical protein